MWYSTTCWSASRTPTPAVKLSLVDTGRLEGVICSTTATTIHYLASKAVGAVAAKGYLRELLALFDVARVDREVLEVPSTWASRTSRTPYCMRRPAATGWRRS